MIQAVFFERTILEQPKILPYDVRVKQYSWNVFGGPEEMSCQADFSGQIDSMLWSMVSNLRCPVWVIDNVGRVVWWGYVHEIKINNGWRSYGISIDTMFNRVKATYELISSGTSTGLRDDTAWQENIASITEFGTREKVYPLVTVSTTAADADVLTRLDKSKYPTSIADLQMRQDLGKSVEFICKGWWYTLDWMYYDNPSTAYADIETQLYDMITTGDFTNDVYIQCDATTLTAEFRQGDNMIRDEAEQLMNIGTDNSRRILAKFNHDRYCILSEEPDPALPENIYYLDKNNQLFDHYGNAIDSTECRVGVWAELKDFEGIAFDTISMIPPSPVFIERATYIVDENTYQPEQRGYKSPYDEIQDIQR